MTSDFASQRFGSGRDDTVRRVGVDDRVAGQAVMEKLLDDRQGMPPRSFIGRAGGRGYVRH